MLPPYTLSAVATHWQFSPVVTAATAFFALCYGWGMVRVFRRHRARPWPAGRAVAFAAGLLVIVLATESGIGAYDDILYTDHMTQHIMLLMIAPPLLVIAQPLTLLLHASRNPLHTWVKRVLRSRVATFLTWPVFGVLAYAAAVLAAHLTVIATYAVASPFWHDTEHVAFLVIGYLFCLPIIGGEPIRWKLSYPMQFALLLLTMPIDTFTGVVLQWASASTPGVLAGPRPAWAGSAVTDIQTGGAVMWAAGDGIMVVLMLVVLAKFASDQRAIGSGRAYFERARAENLAALVASTRPDSGGPAGSPPPLIAAPGRTIDDDEHLAAYNQYLAALNRQR